MVISQKGRKKRKITGGLYKHFRKKRKFEIGREPAMTKIGEEKIKVIKTKGGGSKAKVLVSKQANVFNPETKKHEKAEIKSVVECVANRHFVRRNIIVKGAIIETTLGKARVTSRPGQHGTVNAVLISTKKK